MLRIRPNVALWILCLPHFALVSRGMVVPQVRDTLPCCQMPFAAGSCAAAAASACRGSSAWLWVSPSSCRNSPALCWELHLALPALPWNNCLDPCSRCWGAAAARWGGQLLPWAVEVAGACALRVGWHRGSQNPDPAVTAAGLRPPCKGFRKASLSSCFTAFWKQLLGLSQMPWSLSALTTTFLLNCFLSN